MSIFGKTDSTVTTVSYIKHYFNNVKFTGDVDFYQFNSGSLSLKVGIETKDGVNG